MLKPVHVAMQASDRKDNLVGDLESLSFPVIHEKNLAGLREQDIDPSAIYVVGTSFFRDNRFADATQALRKVGCAVLILAEDAGPMPDFTGRHVQLVPITSQGPTLDVLRAIEMAA